MSDSVGCVSKPASARSAASSTARRSSATYKSTRPFIRRDITADLVAGDDVVVPQARERAGTAHLDRDERFGRIDAKHALPLRRGLR